MNVSAKYFWCLLFHTPVWEGGTFFVSQVFWLAFCLGWVFGLYDSFDRALRGVVVSLQRRV
ncbi:hypothetical protein ACWEKT_21645, partial [Nocardia takedensis]